MRSHRHFRVANQAIDLACIVAALVTAEAAATPDGVTWHPGLVTAGHVVTFAATWLLVSARLGTYLISVRRDRLRALLRVGEAWGTTWGVAGLVTVAALPDPPFSIWLALLLGFVLLAGTRLVLATTPLGTPAGRPRTLVVGASPTARSLSTGKQARQNMDLIGFVPFGGDDPDAMPHLARLGSLASLQDALAAHGCDLVVICPGPATSIGEVHDVIRLCDEVGLGVHYFPPFLDLEHLRLGLTWSENRRGLALHALPNRTAGLLAKRAIDVVGAAAGVALLLPVFVACALAVKLSSRGPVFFRQQRVGRNGEVFSCLKFRTMLVGAQAQQELLRANSVQDGPAFKIPGDPRVTRTGRFMRKFSLDELPQLLNVLAGDMSLVGPRPPIPSEVANYAWWQRRRISVTPGLTCVWQVWGRNRVSFKRWVEMDLFYIDNWSVWLDLKLIAHTFRVVLKGTGM